MFSPGDEPSFAPDETVGRNCGAGRDDLQGGDLWALGKGLCDKDLALLLLCGLCKEDAEEIGRPGVGRSKERCRLKIMGLVRPEPSLVVLRIELKLLLRLEDRENPSPSSLSIYLAPLSPNFMRSWQESHEPELSVSLSLSLLAALFREYFLLRAAILDLR